MRWVTELGTTWPVAHWDKTDLKKDLPICCTLAGSQTVLRLDAVSTRFTQPKGARSEAQVGRCSTVQNTTRQCPFEHFLCVCLCGGTVPWRRRRQHNGKKTRPHSLHSATALAESKWDVVVFWATRNGAGPTEMFLGHSTHCPHTHRHTVPRENPKKVRTIDRWFGLNYIVLENIQFIHTFSSHWIRNTKLVCSLPIGKQ